MYGAKRSPIHRRHAWVETGFIHNTHILWCIEHTVFATYRLPTGKTIIADSASTFLTTFSSNQHYTIGSLRTINSSRSCIFQYIDTFNISRIQSRNVATHTIDKIERLRIAHRTQSTNGYTHAGTRLSGSRDDVHTGCLSLQSRERVRRVQFGNVFTLHLNRSTGYQLLLLNTVTYHDYFIQHFGIFF